MRNQSARAVRVSGMAKRTYSLLFIVTAVLASALATLVGIAATAGTADACTPAGPPQLVVSPSSDLRPGQSIVVSGRHFVTILHKPFTGVVDPNQPVPPCEVEFRPMVGIAITWSGPGVTQVLATVDGYDFEIEVRVPDAAAKGQAVLSAGGATAVVSVGSGGDPCPMATAATSGPNCPDPCSYPPAGASGPTLTIGCPCPAVTSSGGITPGAAIPPWCPDPCPLAAGNAVAPGYPCPDPCVYPAAGQTQAVPRCPDPCPLRPPMPEPEPEPQCGVLTRACTRRPGKPSGANRAR